MNANKDVITKVIITKSCIEKSSSAGFHLAVRVGEIRKRAIRSSLMREISLK